IMCGQFDVHRDGYIFETRAARKVCGFEAINHRTALNGNLVQSFLNKWIRFDEPWRHRQIEVDAVSRLPGATQLNVGPWHRRGTRMCTVDSNICAPRPSRYAQLQRELCVCAIIDGHADVSVPRISGFLCQSDGMATRQFGPEYAGTVKIDPDCIARFSI